MIISSNDKRVLRKLAKQYMDIASLPMQKEKINLWKALNRGEMLRPMVVIDQIPWNELNAEGELTCFVENEFFRQIELDVRKTIYKWTHFPVDMVVEPFITIPQVIVSTGYGLGPSVDKIFLSEEDTAPAQHFKRVLNDYEDIEKIKDIQFIVDYSVNEVHMEQAKEIFNGIAPIIQGHGVQFHLGIWDYLTQLMSIEDAYFEIMDRPEFIHKCMERITEATIAGINRANDLQIYDDISKTCHCSYVYTDELLPDCGEGKGALPNNSWAFGLAQLFSSASPQVTEEFEIPYISRMAEKFGMIYYGCCERLDDRLDIVKRIPNVKKLSCSPWSDKRRFAQEIGETIIMSNKPSPAFIATSSVDWDTVKEDLAQTVKLSKEYNVNLEFILKDISTVKFEPSRLKKWADIAMELVKSY